MKRKQVNETKQERIKLEMALHTCFFCVFVIIELLSSNCVRQPLNVIFTSKLIALFLTHSLEITHISFVVSNKNS